MRVLTLAILAVFGVAVPSFGESAERAESAVSSRQTVPAMSAEGGSGWFKFARNPVLGGQYGTCFDVSVMHEPAGYRIWVSWRPRHCIALVESQDGFTWTQPPRPVLGPRKETGWEDDINRPAVLKHDGKYRMWYTGQAKGHSAIGYAVSEDGIAWKRMSDQPVLAPGAAWEKGAVMCPDVIWDPDTRRYRMYYSAGDQYEPDAIGLATSADGQKWQRHAGNPVFRPDQDQGWEQLKVTGAQVQKHGAWYLMFYIGFRDVDHAQIGVARSRDGISGWQRHPANPIVRPGNNQWDHDACYKPYAVFDGEKWLLWYNGRHGGLEQIGVAIHAGEDLGFPNP